MEFDVFFSISQTPDAAGTFPDETTMYANYLEQLGVADELGFGVAWLAQAHLSTEVQKRNKRPVIPHWEGEVSPFWRTVARLQWLKESGISVLCRKFAGIRGN